MKINQVVKVNIDENGINIIQSVTDEQILLQLLIDRRDKETNKELKEKIRNLIKDLYE